MAAALGLAEAGQRISGFPGLGDGEDERVFFDGRVAVTEFAGVFDLNRNVREFLQQIFPHERGVPTGAAGGDDDLVDGAQFRVREIKPAEFGRAFLQINPPAHGVFHGAGLLEDFLEHEMGEAAALRGFRAELQFGDLHLRGVGPKPSAGDALKRSRVSVTTS